MVVAATCAVGATLGLRSSTSPPSLLLCCASVVGAFAFVACRWRALNFQERRVNKTSLRADRADMAKAPLELTDEDADARFRMEESLQEEWTREREGRFTKPFTFVVAADTQIGISNAVFPWLRRVGGVDPLGKGDDWEWDLRNVERLVDSVNGKYLFVEVRSLQQSERSRSLHRKEAQD